MITVGSLFAGIGGLELGLERTGGFQTKWQVESNVQCCELLRKHGYNPTCADIRETWQSLPPVDLVCGGDPCPKHSRAKSNGKSKHPDLSGYFLAVVGRLRPRWVVRENVPSPTVDWFATALEAIGYGTVTIRINAAKITGQSRQRDFVVGCYQATKESKRGMFLECEDGPGTYTTRLGTRQVTPALTTHRTRYDSRDCYVWSPADGLRILDSEEREALAGFPVGWTAGFSPATRARMCGNAVVPRVAQYIGEQILKANSP